MAVQSRPEPMNASPHHSKVKVSLTLGNSIAVAGEHASGKMEVECRAEKGLGISIIMVELVAIQELTSRDHSATSTFLRSRRLFQGPGLPPSNAVQPYPLPGDPALPRDYHQALRGISTFLFRFPIPSSSPSSINFGGGLAQVKYEIRASVGVSWKGEKRLVTDKKEIDVVESYEEDFARIEPEGVIVGENGKFWAQGRIVGGVAVAGESACVELQVKNHSSKKNTGLSITLTRMLHLPDLPPSAQPPLQISDTLTTVAFRGPEYIIHPNSEGVANLVFDVPKGTRGVKGGTREADEGDIKSTEPLFEVRCIVAVKITMGIGSKDLVLNLPVTIVHPAAVPQLPSSSPSPYLYSSSTPERVAPPQPPISPRPYPDLINAPYIRPPLPITPPYLDPGHIWFPPPTQTPIPYQFYTPPLSSQQYYFSPPQAMLPSPPRSSSAGAYASVPPDHIAPQPHLPLDLPPQQSIEPEEGKGERASRIAQTLHFSSRNRSASPQSHRFPLLPNHSSSEAVPAFATMQNLQPPPPPSDPAGVPVHSPRPVLSPKQSFYATHNSLPRSERVEELERMAEEVTAKSKDLSGDIPKEHPSYSEKTLPAPPVPSEKDRKLLDAPKPPLDAIFVIDEAVGIVHSDKAPPTPTLTAITPLKQHHRPSDLCGLGLGLGLGESGLDALERRLIAEVGTRKMDFERRPDVRTVLPISIPAPRAEADEEPLNDSAISSLTLADCVETVETVENDSDERTHRAWRGSMSGDDRERDRDRGWVGEGEGEERRGRRKEKKKRKKDGDEAVMEKDEERKKGKKKERVKDGEAHKFRKAAKGRVADWLERIDPDIPPPENLNTIPLADAPPGQPVAKKLPAADFERPPRPVENDLDAKDVSSAPNPRSSGFVPIGTLNRDTFKRLPALRDSPKDKRTNAVEDGTKHVEFSASPVRTNHVSAVVRSSPAKAVQVFDTTGAFSPTSLHTKPAVAISGHARIPAEVTGPTSAKVDSKTGMKLSPHLPVFPPTQRAEDVKYDIRSARGGRGGHVAAVASIWASGAVQQSSNQLGNDAKAPAPAPRPLRTVGKLPLSRSNAHTSSSPALSPSTALEAPKLVDLSGKRSRPVVKSASVPAIISSSHATPMISSTASLARVSPTSNHHMNTPMVKVLPSHVSEIPTEVRVKESGKSPVRDLGFGKARLRDLIRKYQEQAT